ncbi:MAG: CRTAC1 family protein [Gemmatimonadales bacterium]
MKSALLLGITIACILDARAGAAQLFEVVGRGSPVEDRGISRGAAWGDFDGDGDPDLFVSRPTWEGRVQQNMLYRNDGDGRFSRVPGSFGPPGAWEGVVWVDADGDGDLDLHVVGRDGAGSLLFANSGGTLTLLRPDPLNDNVHAASMACWADADGDGRLDVFVVGSGAGRNALFRNEGAWRFTPVRLPDQPEDTGAGRACAWTDLDGDGLPELALANARRPNVLLRNRGGMRLEPDLNAPLVRDTAYGYGLSAPDVNEDGLRDLFVANFDDDNRLYLGDGTGMLTPASLGDQLQSAATKGHVWGDFDLDGRVDAYLGSGTPRPGMVNRLYIAAEPGLYELVAAGEFAEHADTSAAVAAADYDLDGDLDLFVANWGSHGSVNRLYRNSATRGWLKVRLQGVCSNRMGVGARVSVLTTVHGERRWLHRWLDAATGYAGQNEPVMHFGLGDAREADSLVVTWPSGNIDRFGRVSAGRTVLIREGAFAVASYRSGSRTRLFRNALGPDLHLSVISRAGDARCLNRNR